MSTTSISAFNEVQEFLPERRKEVYNAIAKNPNSSFYDIAKILKWNLNQVSSRVNELINSGLIERTGIQKIGKFERELFSIIEDREEVIKKQKVLYQLFIETKTDLENDYERCETENGKQLLKKRIDHYEIKIRNLKIIQNEL